MRYYFLPFCACIMWISFSGCSKDTGRPSDLPKLFPCRITITQNEQPLPEAVVTLKSMDSGAKYATSSGITDENGLVAPNTYSYKGVPVGKYKVTVKKTVEEGGTEVSTGPGTTRISGAKVYSLIKKEFTNEITTPLTIEITEGENTETLDVGASARDFIYTTQ